MYSPSKTIPQQSNGLVHSPTNLATSPRAFNAHVFIVILDLSGAPRDEITEWQRGRYLCATECAWRIFAYTTYERIPHIICLPVHCEGEDMIVYDAGLPYHRRLACCFQAPLKITVTTLAILLLATSCSKTFWKMQNIGYIHKCTILVSTQRPQNICIECVWVAKASSTAGFIKHGKLC